MLTEKNYNGLDSTILLWVIVSMITGMTYVGYLLTVIAEVKLKSAVKLRTCCKDILSGVF